MNLEKIFEEEMQKGMIQYNSAKFNVRYPTLKGVIFNIMKRVKVESQKEINQNK